MSTPSGRLRILAVEPYYGGSHRAVLDGLVRTVEADWTLLTLPARKWKWRMRGSAITMAAEIRRRHETGEAWDLIFASTFVNLAELRGLCGPALERVPAIVYFHENQLVYPNRHTAEWDYQFPLTNITTALTAERCLFNTRWNLDTFLSEIPGFVREFPDHHPTGLSEVIARKSEVLAPPFDPTEFDRVLGNGGARTAPRGAACRIIWPHRWEHDKRPEAFFSAVTSLADDGHDFEVVVAGQAFRETSEVVRGAAGALGRRLVACEEPTDRTEYVRLLAGSDVAVSTADNEFFGIAMVEACYAGCFPLVPDRLAYPDVYPDRFRYADDAALVARLRELIAMRPSAGEARTIAEQYTLDTLAPHYARVFAEVAAGGRV